MTLILAGAIIGKEIAGVTQTRLTYVKDPIILVQSLPTFFPGITSYVDIGTNNIKGLVPTASPIRMWEYFYGLVGCDHNYVTDRIKEAYEDQKTSDDYDDPTQTFGELTPEEQKILLAHFIDPAALNSVFSPTQINTAFQEYLPKSIAARKARYAAVGAMIALKMGLNVAQDIRKALKASNDVRAYEDSGDLGLVDFLNSIGDYSGKGFNELPSVAALTTNVTDPIKADLEAILVRGELADGSLYR